MIRNVLLMAVVLGAVACSESTSKTAQDPSTTSVTAAPVKSHVDKKPAAPEAEENEDHGDSLRN